MKTKFKRQWTQAVAVAAAAVCAVTATCAGVTINHVDAADETATSYGTVYVSFAGADQQNGSTIQYWGEGDSSNAGCTATSVEILGNGTYTASIAVDSTVNVLFFLALDSNVTTSGCSFTGESITIDGVEVDYTCTQTVYMDKNGYRLKIGGSWSDAKDYSLDSGVISESVEVTFTVSGLATDAPIEETTTTTTETTTTTTETTTTTTETTTTAPDTTESSETTTTESDVTESSETTTTTTTTEPDTTESSETTSTTEKTESSASETTTTTKETTATTTTTTATTTTPKATTTTTTTAPNYDKVITAFTKQSEKGEDGKIYPFIEVEHNNAKSITLVYKVLTDDTNTSGAIGTGGANWSQESWNELAVPTDKLVVIDYVVPSTATETLKISVYWPGVSGVEFKSVTLHYDSDPDVTTTEFESDLTFETVTVHEKETHKIDMLDRCYIIETIKADPGYTISGGMYSGTEKDTYYTSDSWKETVGESQIIVKEYDIRGAYDASYGIFYYGKDAEKRTSVEVNIQTFYTGDASMNGKVNGSDVRAIVNYIVSGEETNAQNVICDYDYDGKVALADAVTLTKALLGSYTTQALNS